jgi:hypothetical protein
LFAGRLRNRRWLAARERGDRRLVRRDGPNILNMGKLR